jgi:hypothetical protein
MNFLGPSDPVQQWTKCQFVALRSSETSVTTNLHGVISHRPRIFNVYSKSHALVCSTTWTDLSWNPSGDTTMTVGAFLNMTPFSLVTIYRCFRKTAASILRVEAGSAAQRILGTINGITQHTKCERRKAQHSWVRLDFCSNDTDRKQGRLSTAVLSLGEAECDTDHCLVINSSQRRICCRDV